jgi:hypothetical protein
VSVWYPAFGLGQLFTNDSNKDEDVLQLEFIKEEPDLIDLYESDDYSQRAREHVRKIKKENTEVIDISDDSDSQVPASLAPSRTSGQSGSRSSFSSHSSLPDFKPRDHDPKRRKYIVDSDEDEDDAIMMSMPQKRKRKAGFIRKFLMAFGMTSIRHPIRSRRNTPEQMPIPVLNFLF